jgi:predicted  nucleic acid-binding Zn-ribbon protein
MSLDAIINSFTTTLKNLEEFISHSNKSMEAITQNIELLENQYNDIDLDREKAERIKSKLQDLLA